VRRHELDWVSLIVGLVFTAFAVVYLISPAVNLDLDGRYVWPVVLVALGAAGLATALRANAREEREFAAAQTATGDDQPPPLA
jgi:uncharacterized integral membrane protein